MKDIDRIISKIKGLLAKSNDDAAAPNEREVALRKANEFLIAHSLSRDDVLRDDGILDVSQVSYGRYRTFSYGQRMTQWQNNLGWFVTNFFGSIKWYLERDIPKDSLINKMSRIPSDIGTAVYFYGPDEDSESAAKLYTELQEAIATTTTMLYSSYFRGEGASYAEGFVTGLSLANTQAVKKLKDSNQETYQLVIQNTELVKALEERCDPWLKAIHGIKIRKGSGMKRRKDIGWEAMQKGISHGKKYEVDKPKINKKLRG